MNLENGSCLTNERNYKHIYAVYYKSLLPTAASFMTELCVIRQFISELLVFVIKSDFLICVKQQLVRNVNVGVSAFT